MTDHVKTTIETYNRIAADYRLTAVPELRAWEEDSMRIFQRMLPGRSVLVPGCGDGRDSWFLRKLGLTVTSFDLSDEMLALAKINDPAGIYKHLDIRSIKKLHSKFDGVYASGCLYHLTRSEFSDFLSNAPLVMSDQGILYLNMKLGTGNEMKAMPGKGYPGGSISKTLLTGPRYYEYYSHEELLELFSAYSVIRWRNMEVQKEGVHEYWLRLGSDHDEHPGGIRHKHAVNKIVARRPVFGQ